jgi:hypothetical protein
MEKEIIVFSQRFETISEAIEVMNFLQQLAGHREVSACVHEDSYGAMKWFEARVGISTED